jgi:D-glycero-alpha-D-manno-heptose-7-phosphate kinase
MIITKTPFRISFVGGGSDHFNSSSNVPGRVICTTINKYIYVSVNKKYNNKVRLSYSQTENVDNVKELDHLIIRKTLEHFNVNKGIEIVTVADIPSSGSGLGSSSALTVGLTNALRKIQHKKINKKILGQEASKIEIINCDKPIGMQDHYAAAYGGFNSILFKKDKTVTVKKIKITNHRMNNFKDHLMMFYSGINRKADKILGKIKKEKKENTNYEKLSNLARDFEYELINGNLLNLGSILHENWILKRNLHKIVSNLSLNKIYEDAMSAGAIGGKLLGAGGGGYFLFFVEPENQKNVKKKLSKFQCIDFNFSDDGSRIFNI